MLLPQPRGPLSQDLINALRTGTSPQAIGPSGWTPSGPVLDDPDVQVSLWILYELHFRGFEDAEGDREWDPALLALRAELEAPFEAELRAGARDRVAAVEDQRDIGSGVLAMAAAEDGPSLASYLHREATREQFEEFLRQRSLYHLKESDPHSLVTARMDGAPKVALAELQYDEYGGGRPERLHATLFGDALEALGIDRTYGAHVEEVTALTFAVNNLMALCCLHRRLRGAAMGHLAAFEATSSIPSRKIAAGADRLDLPGEVAEYYLEHVEADAVHEQVAARDICGGLVAQDPELREDVLFGAAACLYLDERAAAEQLDRWRPTPVQAAS